MSEDILDISCETDKVEEASDENQEKKDIEMIIDDEVLDSPNQLNTQDYGKMKEMFEKFPEKFQAIMDQNQDEEDKENSLEISIDEQVDENRSEDK